MRSVARGRGLGLGWGVVSATPPGDPVRVQRGLLERLVVPDPDTGELIDLGPVRPDAIAASLVMPAGLPAPRATVPIPSDHGFLLLSLRHVATSNSYRVSFLQEDSAAQRPWQSQAMDAAMVLGTAQQPFPLWTPEGRGPGPQFLPPDSSLYIDATDLSGAPNTALIVLEGAFIPRGDLDLQRLARWASETLFVHVKAFTIPASGRIEAPDPNAIIQTSGEAPVVLHYINSTNAAGWNFQAKGVNESPWFTNPIPIECLAGTGALPGGQVLPRGVAKAQNLELTAINRTAAPITPRLHLVCTKDWRHG